MLLLLYPRPFLIVPIVVIRLVDKYVCAMHMRRCTRRARALVYRMFGNFRMFPNNPEIDIFLPTILQITITGVIVFIYLFNGNEYPFDTEKMIYKRIEWI